MSVAVSVAAISASNAAIASAAAHSAKVDRCKGVISTFDSHGASVVQMQEYAACVDTVFPPEVSHGNVIVYKALFVIALIGLAIGAYRGMKEKDTYWGNWGDVILYGLLGFVLTPLAVLAVGLLGGGIVWLFA